jgi:hypothetical protein
VELSVIGKRARASAPLLLESAGAISHRDGGQSPPSRASAKSHTCMPPAAARGRQASSALSPHHRISACRAIMTCSLRLRPSVPARSTGHRPLGPLATRPSPPLLRWPGRIMRQSTHRLFHCGCPSLAESVCFPCRDRPGDHHHWLHASYPAVVAHGLSQAHTLLACIHPCPHT